LSSDGARLGAHRDADRQLLPSSGGARQHEVGHIGAADEKYGAYGTEENEDRTANVAE
jgi:hypothetical protein